MHFFFKVGWWARHSTPCTRRLRRHVSLLSPMYGVFGVLDFHWGLFSTRSAIKLVARFVKHVFGITRLPINPFSSECLFFFCDSFRFLIIDIGFGIDRASHSLFPNYRAPILYNQERGPIKKKKPCYINRCCRHCGLGFPSSSLPSYKLLASDQRRRT